MEFALIQQNYTVGDLAGNAKKIIHAVKTFNTCKPEICITSELSICGYPPKDLLLKSQFIESCHKHAEIIADELKDYPPVLIGIPLYSHKRNGKPLYNGAVLLKDGKILQEYYKSLLPTYDVFDEGRYFEESKSVNMLEINNKRLGITICEDVWNDCDFDSLQKYSYDPLLSFVPERIDYIVNISASPFTIGKQKQREKIFKNITSKFKKPLVYVNQVGGNDDLVFDGRSCIFDSFGKMKAKAKAFSEDIFIADINNNNVQEDDYTTESEAWNALVLGTRDYIHKCGFTKAVIGLSGGIDSSLVAAIATEAIGNNNVIGVIMPSVFTSNESKKDAYKLASNLKIKTVVLQINCVMASYTKILSKLFKGHPKDETEENIQARIRGNLLMALSNKFNYIVLSTGNKSELSVGYCTLYGDLSGGLSVISDVPKTLVYKIARWLNKRKSELIPESIIRKEPTAELKEDQKDTDKLPPYNLLDEILYQYIELRKSKEEILKSGFDKNLVDKICKSVNKTEYKRKQSPIGIKITDRAFGTGWRMPIASKYTE